MDSRKGWGRSRFLSGEAWRPGLARRFVAGAGGDREGLWAAIVGARGARSPGGRRLRDGIQRRALRHGLLRAHGSGAGGRNTIPLHSGTEAAVNEDASSVKRGILDVAA